MISAAANLEQHGRRYIVLSDDPLIGDDVVCLITEHDPGSDVQLVRTLKSAMGLVLDQLSVSALFLVSPQLQISENPLLPLLQARNAWLVILSSRDDVEVPGGLNILTGKIPYSDKSVGRLVSRVRDTRPSG